MCLNLTFIAPLIVGKILSWIYKNVTNRQILEDLGHKIGEFKIIFFNWWKK